MTDTLFWAIIFSFWLLCCVTQLFYWVRVFFVINKWHPSGNASMEGVSVVICTNELTGQLKSLLTALTAQDYASYEVILVNDGPVPEVGELLKEFQGSGLTREVVLDSSTKRSPGKKEALALGIQSAQHEWILLTDADCTITRHWISAMMAETSKERKVVLGYGPFEYRPGLVNAFARYDNLLIAMQYLGFAQRGTPYMGVGRNLLYARDLVLQEGHSDLDLASGDDDLFIQKVATGWNTAICLSPESFAISSSQPGWGNFIHQKRRHVSTGPRYSKRAQRQLGIFALSFIGWWLSAIVIMMNATSVASPIILACLAVGVLQWYVFGTIARKLKVNGITTWFLPLSLLYTFFLVGLGLLMLIGPPRTWKKS